MFMLPIGFFPELHALMCACSDQEGRPPHGVDESAALLARDQFGANMIAINASGNIVALNTWPSYIFSSRGVYAEAAKLIANSLMFVAGSPERGI